MKPKKPSTKESERQLTPKELREKHLKDPKHHITEEELKNLKIGSDAEGLEKKEQEKFEELESQIGKHPPNLYEILGE